MGSKIWSSKVVVVTGASAGVGRAIVRRLAEAGASIALLARDPERLEAARAEVTQYGARALALPVDVAYADQIESAAQRIEEQLGPIDVWINNAMVSVLAPVKDLTADEIRRVTEVTYLGYVHGTLAALRRMLPRNRGTIVQVGSALAYRSIPLQAAYCGAKHAIVGFTESLRCELLHDRSRVKVCMVHIPGTNTPQFDWIRNKLPFKSRPVGECLQPEVAADAVKWAVEHDRAELFLGFDTVKAVTANKIAPRLVDRYLARIVYEGHQRLGQYDDPHRPDNLFAPVAGDQAARGPFSDEAAEDSLHLSWTKHRRWITLTGLGFSGLMYLSRRSRKRQLEKARSPKFHFYDPTARHESA